MPGPSAAELRKVFRIIPWEERDAQQSFSIRFWRAPSWLDRAEHSADEYGKPQQVSMT